MKKYIGFKMIQAEPVIKKGGVIYKLDEPIPKTIDPVYEGYRVVDPEGNVTFANKANFEKLYLEVGDKNTITQQNVDDFILLSHATTMGDKTTVVRTTLANGFEIVESSSCVDPANYDMGLGAEICIEHTKDKVWNLLGFLLQTARYGIKKSI